jgi:hypothetical protein
MNNLFLTGVFFLCFVSVGRAQQNQNFSNVEIRILPVRENIYMLVGAGSNITVQTGSDGALIVDAQVAPFSVVTEDWRFRMLTPSKGDYPDVTPLNDAGKKIADSWDPEKDEKAGEQCKGYGAANIMRIPMRLRFSWADDNTLKLETDAGTQTRLFRFGTPAPPAGAPGWQGFSIAQWETPASRGPGGSLKVVTTRMRPGYLQKNGVPYSASATMTEYFDTVKEPNGDEWLVVKSIIEDPVYLSRSFIRSTHFRKQSGASGWNPTPCSAR